MTASGIHRLENGRASYYIHLPDVTPRAFVFVLDADGINGSWYRTPNIRTPVDQESTDKPLVSYVNETWDWEKRTNGRLLNRPGVEHSAGLLIEEPGSLGSDANVSTPNISHAIDQQSSLSDGFDADDSGNIRTYSYAFKRDHQPEEESIFLPKHRRGYQNRDEYGKLPDIGNRR